MAMAQVAAVAWVQPPARELLDAAEEAKKKKKSAFLPTIMEPRCQRHDSMMKFKT